MRRIAVTALAAVIGTVGVGCAGHHHHVDHQGRHHRTSQVGYVTGFTRGCGPAHIAFLPVRVTAIRNGNVVAIRIVRSSTHMGRYRMELAPGRYLLSAQRSGLRPEMVIIRPGRIVIANFEGTCS
jgi:hypothetical protein